MKISDLADLTANLPESQKIRIYLVSLLGVSEAEASDPSKTEVIYYHTPSLIEAQSIKMAVDIAKQQAEDLWPKAEGWIIRSVSVEPFEPQGIQTLLQYWQGGLLAQEINPPEAGVNVNLDASSDSQSIILGETDKPAS